MENEKQRKPRTIQMKYPAQYSQSWNDENPVRVNAQTVKKSRLNNVNIVRSQNAPVTHSWANELSDRADDRADRRAKRKVLTRGSTQIVYPLPFPNIGPSSERKIARPRKNNPVARKQAPRQAGGCCWRPRPDPTVPHLKYGLFPPKKTVVKSQAQTATEVEHANKKEKKIKQQQVTIRLDPAEGAPHFMFRAIDPRYTRQLSLTPPTHVDIRPRSKHTVEQPPRRGEDFALET